MIPLTECVDRRLYRIQARNFKIGVFCLKQRGFYGIRTKFGQRFVDLEFHWDTGEPYGTVKPTQDLQIVLPTEVSLDENPLEKDSNYKALFAWLEKQTQDNPGPMDIMGTPWTPEQVASLEEFQNCGKLHPYTGASGEVLVPSTDGWVQADGTIRQRWAYRCTLDGTWKDLTQTAYFDIAAK